MDHNKHGTAYFEKFPSFSQNNDGLTFTVDQPFTFVTGRRQIILVPKGFRTDLASIPNLAIIGSISMLVWIIIYWHARWKIAKHAGLVMVGVNFALVWLSDKLRPYGKYTNAAIVHDYLYRENPFHWPRLHCDWVFYEAMKCCDTLLWQRIIILFGVRIGGWIAWFRNRRRLLASPVPTMPNKPTPVPKPQTSNPSMTADTQNRA